MIEYPGLLIVGRKEKVEPDTRWLWEQLVAVSRRARGAWEHRWRDKIDRWDEWNTIACIGKWGKWHTYDFLHWDGLGDSPVPWLRARWRYTPLIDAIDPQPIPDDPPVLHGSSRVLSTEHWPIKLPGTWSKDPKSRLIEIERQLEELNIHVHPHSQTHSGVPRVLADRGYELSAPYQKGIEWGKGRAGWKLVPLTQPSRILPTGDLPKAQEWVNIDQAVAP